VMPLTSRTTAIHQAVNNLREYAGDLQSERDSLKRQIETWEETNADLVHRNNEHWAVRKQQAADLAACRRLLAALVAASEAMDAGEEEWQPAPVRRQRKAQYQAAWDDIRAYLAAHPAPEGGQDDA
jgi:peptidoglycan hydrolase CwlO-like protein